MRAKLHQCVFIKVHQRERERNFESVEKKKPSQNNNQHFHINCVFEQMLLKHCSNIHPFRIFGTVEFFFWQETRTMRFKIQCHCIIYGSSMVYTLYEICYVKYLNTVLLTGTLNIIRLTFIHFKIIISEVLRKAQQTVVKRHKSGDANKALRFNIDSVDL